MTGGVGVSLGVAAVLTSLILNSKRGCDAFSPSFESCIDDRTRRDKTSRALLAVGGGVMLTSIVLAILIHPSQDEIRATFDQWNLRHPDASSEVAPVRNFSGL
jgi:hypothetical protein